jgi:hypothetical protein
MLESVAIQAATHLPELHIILQAGSQVVSLAILGRLGGLGRGAGGGLGQKLGGLHGAGNKNHPLVSRGPIALHESPPTFATLRLASGYGKAHEKNLETTSDKGLKPLAQDSRSVDRSILDRPIR